jgi:hypothetical protein
MQIRVRENSTTKPHLRVRLSAGQSGIRNLLLGALLIFGVAAIRMDTFTGITVSTSLATALLRRVRVITTG